MDEHYEEEIIKELEEEDKRLQSIQTVIGKVKEKLLEKRPSHFSKRDIVNAMFGAFIIGLTFMFKGLLIEVGLNLSWSNVVVIITSTLVILTTQIYFIGYSRVVDKERRKFGQFYLKRLLTLYVIAMVTSFYLLYIFGFAFLTGSFAGFMKLVFVLAMPCAVGAAVPNLLKRY